MDQSRIGPRSITAPLRRNIKRGLISGFHIIVSNPSLPSCHNMQIAVRFHRYSNLAYPWVWNVGMELPERGSFSEGMISWFRGIEAKKWEL